MEGQLTFVKNFMNINGWEQATITEQEGKNIQDALRKKNNQKIYEECLNDSERALKRFIVAYSNPIKHITDTANKLFEKRAIHSLTAYQEFLKAKIEKIRNGNSEDVSA